MVTNTINKSGNRSNDNERYYLLPRSLGLEPHHQEQLIIMNKRSIFYGIIFHYSHSSYSKLHGRVVLFFTQQWLTGIYLKLDYLFYFCFIDGHLLILLTIYYNTNLLSTVNKINLLTIVLILEWIKRFVVIWVILICRVYIMWQKQFCPWKIHAKINSNVVVGALIYCALLPVEYDLKAAQMNVQRSVI